VTGIEGLSPAKRALLERALRQRRQASGAPRTAIPRRRERGPAPLSFSQQRMWFLAQWEPDAPTFNGARAIRLVGPLDADALKHGLATILERHESLRTVVVGTDDPRQVVLDTWSFELPVIRPAELELPDIRPAESGRQADENATQADEGAPQRDQGARKGDQRAIRALLRELSREPFDLSCDLMLRATLIELSDEEHVLLIRMHHIAADAHSDGVLFGELAELYNARVEGRPPRLPELPIQYSDFAVWQRDRLRGSRLDGLIAYWTAQLENAPALLKLPTDRPRRAVQRHEGAHLELALPRTIVQPLVALGRAEGDTFFMTMLALFSVLLYRITGEPDIVLGSPIANRNDLELAPLIGFFTNTIALRIRLDGNPTFRQVMRRAREAALGAYAHQDLPFEKVVEALAPKRDPSYNPLFQVNFRAQATERPALRLAGIRAEPIPLDIGFSRFDLALELELREHALTGYFEYDRDLFDPDSVAVLVEDLGALLTAVGADPDAPILVGKLPSQQPTARQRNAGRTIARRLPK
jgi:hypothetical protein